MLVLGIETTCDETAIAVVRDGRAILSNTIGSQVDLHRQFGGVFPEHASRRHFDDFLPILEASLEEARVAPTDIDLIAVANKPGLMGSLLMGVMGAKALALGWKKPLVGVNHIEAHLYASIMSQEGPPLFPALGVILSGGHTHLVKILDIGHYELISQTVDDAVGEAFDKVAALLGLPYPGGPEIEALAKEGDPLKHPFKGGRVKKDPLAFSFSGLKTSVRYALKEPFRKEDIAASFQRAAFADIVEKSLKATETFDCQAIYLGGGVTNSRALRSFFPQKYPLFWPAPGLSLDNGAMIAGLGFHNFQKHKKCQIFDLSIEPRVRFG